MADGSGPDGGSGSGGSGSDGGSVEVFEEQRPRLTGLAYRMLGSVQEAEDVVQEAYLRWSKATGVEVPAAWLTRVVTNLCLNELGSARVRREAYAGPWLPEPMVTDADPAELRESVSYAMLTLMERLTPAERAVFVLKEAFGYSHREIAGFLGESEANTRQLHSRARRDLTAGPRFRPSEPEQRRLIDRFMTAALEGDLDGLTSLLSEQVTVWSDGGGKVTAARNPVTGRAKVLRLLTGLMLKHADAEPRMLSLNGEPALAFFWDGLLGAVTFFEFDTTGNLTAARLILNPDKLSHL
ncbi:RNA polymerase sigma factor SigJ [Actinocorallia longicatena]|uniref:RNA polymerase sigma-70 factor n=1 Tax=Actinocorallia longicatena TaxID=111803 RepID=A0ABP6QA70_9ACTN